MKAITKKNQPAFNRTIKALNRYNAFNALREKTENENEKGIGMNKINRLCESAFDTFLNYLYELPKYEQKRIEKSELY